MDKEMIARPFDMGDEEPKRPSPYKQYMDFLTQMSLTEQNEMLLQLLNELETYRRNEQKRMEEALKLVTEANKIFDKIRGRD